MSESLKRELLNGLGQVTLLKEGGQKDVYKVEHPTYGTCVFKFGRGYNSNALERARREVSLQRSLPSEYFPTVYEFVSDDKWYYIFEEFIESCTLSDLISTYSSSVDIITLIQNIVNALHPLWDMNIAHRDIKPDNILITNTGKPIIIDLGIMRNPKDDSITLSLAPLGPCTPLYASPEQLTNNKKAIDPRTDQFAIGIIAFLLFSRGIHPFDPIYVGSGEDIPNNILSHNYSDKFLTDNCLPNTIINFINRCLSFHPYQRYRNYSQIKETLDQIKGEL